MTPEQLRFAAENAIAEVHTITEQYHPAQGPWPMLAKIQGILDELRANA